MQLIANFNGDPELLRQQVEAILGVASIDNDWSLSGYIGTIILINNSSLELAQEEFENIVLFSETIGNQWNSSLFTWNTVTRVFDENTNLAITAAKLNIDIEAGNTRSKYLTITPGQEATYVAKETECIAYRAAGYPELTTDFEWVQAEADATGLTPAQAADAILIQAAQWKVLGSLIEKTRRQGKLALDALVNPTIADIKASSELTIAVLKAI